MTTPAPTRLQSLLWPEAGLNTERDVYVRLTRGAAFSIANRQVYFIPGAAADFGTYNNLFNSGKWRTHCTLETLELELTGDGQFELAVFHAQPERSSERVINRIVTLTSDAPQNFDVVPLGGLKDIGVLFFQLTALTEGRIDQAHWQTADAPRRTPDLMLSVTTFRREDAVARTSKRFEEFARDTAIAKHVHLTVVDNGHSTDIAQSAHVSVIPNANLGGSGGFARGLLEAQTRGASHCLFMDDDASVHMDCISRTWMFLAYATDPDTAVAGAVANAQYRWKLWENGALFDRVCQPQHSGKDLRDLLEVLKIEFDSTTSPPHNFYGGWWYFAFPVAHVQHMPFPFFVRGDDVSFALVHDFNIITLPGVISYQDEDFSVKESPLTVYLDLRSHMAHHLSLPAMEIGRVGMMKIIARFYLRGLLFCHYDTLEAIGLALDDVLAGPDYFAANPDIAARRKQISVLTDAERWRPVTKTPRSTCSTPRRRIEPDRWLPRLAMKLTLNGHLLPGFRSFGNRISMGADKRGQLRPVWGAAQISYVSANGARSYTVEHSKKRATETTLPILRAAWILWRTYNTVRDDWRKGYTSLTKPSFWRKLLSVKPDSEAPPSPGA
jgi:hypothetical protein